MSGWTRSGSGDAFHPNITVADGVAYIHYGEAHQQVVTDEMFESWGYVRSEDPWRWLESTRHLQQEAFHDYDWPKQGDALARSVIENHTSLVTELGEALNEVGWKPWTRNRGWVNREAFIRELVDAGHFLANLLMAVGCTDEEWERLYREKQDINLKRQREGYDGVSSKCPGCKRALDDPATECAPVEFAEYFVHCAVRDRVFSVLARDVVDPHRCPEHNEEFIAEDASGRLTCPAGDEWRIIYGMFRPADLQLEG